MSILYESHLGALAGPFCDSHDKNRCFILNSHCIFRLNNKFYFSEFGGVFIIQGIVLNPGRVDLRRNFCQKGLKMGRTDAHQDMKHGTSLMVQWLRLGAPDAWVQSLARELDPECHH